MPTILDNILIPEILATINDHKANLLEADHQARLKSVVISNIPDEATLIKGDETQIKDFFRNIRRGHNKRCDYLLIAHNTIFFVEIKSSPDAPETLADDCIKKFKAAKCVIEYFDKVLQEFNDQYFFNQMNRRYILFYLAPPILKLTTSLKPSGVQLQLNNQPDRFKSIPVTDGALIDISLLG